MSSLEKTIGIVKQALASIRRVLMFFQNIHTYPYFLGNLLVGVSQWAQGSRWLMGGREPQGLQREGASV